MSPPKRSVYIVGAEYGYKEMFQSAGWEIEESWSSADLIQFTGGSDVSPALYGQDMHSKTSTSPFRDKGEEIMFLMSLQAKKPMAGICRGGQFLNVMCGGDLWQDVNNHALATNHVATDKRSGETFDVSSTHHQMMRPNRHAETILVASEATKFERCNLTGTQNREILVIDTDHEDIEALYYREENVFCFQPHPEFLECSDLAVRYFDYIEELLFKGEH